MSFSNAQNAALGLQATYRGDAITKLKADAFIPELWSSEVKRFLDAQFVVRQHVKTSFFSSGKKGDRIHVPNISRAAVNRKLPETPVTLQARTEADWFIDIDQYAESSFMIEDIVGIQASYALREEYTREAGYALSRDIDNFLLGYRAALAGYNVSSFVGSQVVNSTDAAGTTSAPLQYNALLRAKLKMDAADVPQEGRVLIVSPTQYNQLLAVDKFISMFYVDFRPVSTGHVGSIFGMPVYMTSQLGANSATGYVNGTGGTAAPTPGVVGSPYLPSQVESGAASQPLPTTWNQASNSTVGIAAGAGAGGTEVHTAIMCHKDWLALGMQQEPKTESSRETLYLADALVCTQLYGAKVFRYTNAVLINTNGTLPVVS